MILASGARGRGFDSPLSPHYSCFFWTLNKSHKPSGALFGHCWEASPTPANPLRGGPAPMRCPLLPASSAPPIACCSRRPVAALPCSWARQGCMLPERHPTPNLRGGSAPRPTSRPLADRLSKHCRLTSSPEAAAAPARLRPAGLRAAPPPGGGGGNCPRRRRRGCRRPSACKSICCQS